MKVYLAGGMHSNWREAVIERFPGIQFFDPSKHGLTNENEYTQWDLEAIDKSNVVFAYMDSANPSGFGLSLEVGYAYGIRCPVLYVCEDDTPRQKYFGMVRYCSTVAKSLEDGMKALALFDAHRIGGRR